MPTGYYVRTEENRRKKSEAMKAYFLKNPKPKGVKVGAKHNSWKGGIYYRDGYRWVWTAVYTLVAEHRMVMEKYLGRKLNSDELVHHKDGNKLNNDIDNLEIVNRSKHFKIHFKDIQEAYKEARQKPDYRGGNWKIPKEKRSEIYSKFKSGKTSRELSIEYGICVGQVFRIISLVKKERR